jgi:hypothetical protein
VMERLLFLMDQNRVEMLVRQHGTEAANESILVGSGFEGPEFFVLFNIDLVGIDWATGKVQQCGILGGNKLVNFLDRSGFCCTCVRAKLCPEHPYQDVAF